jgi:hypothetical protein
MIPAAIGQRAHPFDIRVKESIEQDNAFTPSGWLDAPQQTLYHDVVKQSCRTCHVAFDADTSEFLAERELRHLHGPRAGHPAPLLKSRNVAGR